MEKFTKIRSAKDWIISVSLIIAGIVCIITPSGVSLNILGAVLIFTSILLFMTMRSAWKETETGIIFSKKERYFAQSKKEPFLKALKEKDFNSIDLKEEDKGNGMRMDVYTDGKQQVYIQLFEYIPYKYEACSELMPFELKETEKLLA